MGYRKACRYIDSWHSHERAFAQSLYHDHFRPLWRRRVRRVLWSLLGIQLTAVAGVQTVYMALGGPEIVPYGALIASSLALVAFIFALTHGVKIRRIKGMLINLHINWKQMIPPTQRDAELTNGRYGERTFWQVVAGLRYADRTVPANHKIEAMLRQRI